MNRACPFVLLLSLLSLSSFSSACPFRLLCPLRLLFVLPFVLLIFWFGFLVCEAASSPAATQTAGFFLPIWPPLPKLAKRFSGFFSTTNRKNTGLLGEMHGKKGRKEGRFFLELEQTSVQINVVERLFSGNHLERLTVLILHDSQIPRAFFGDPRNEEPDNFSICKHDGLFCDSLGN